MRQAVRVGRQILFQKEGQIFGGAPVDVEIDLRNAEQGKRDRWQSPLDRGGGHLPRRNDLKRTIHSLRNAVIGSMRPAPRAGM
jgi:hypothetical protein